MKLPMQTLSASSLAGNHVTNPQGEDLGSIEDFMINTQTGCIEYAVLSFGGIFGIGDKLFAVPWDALNLDQENKRFVIGLDKTRLEKAPGFDKDNWPDMADTAWRELISDYYRSS